MEGPGKPGELYIKGERADSRFFYSAPPPLATLRPTDIVGFDYAGLPVATRVVGYTREPIAAAIDPLMQGDPDLTGAPRHSPGPGSARPACNWASTGPEPVHKHTNRGTNGNGRGHWLGPLSKMPSSSKKNLTDPMLYAGGGPTAVVPLMAQVPVGQLTVQAQRQAAVSAQTPGGCRRARRYNKDVNQANDRATAALQIALARDRARSEKHGGSGGPSFWKRPRPLPLSSPARPGELANLGRKARMLPAFGAETTLLTLTGSQPVEAIRAGTWF